MAKGKTIYVCSSCGYESPGWLGKCPSCQSWNSFAEEKIAADTTAKPSRRQSWSGEKSTISLSDVKGDESSRFSSGLEELDRVLGGGFVEGSIVLVGGDPGIGKSTLLLQACHLAKARGDVLYISGEESAVQIRLRANRLGADTSHITLSTHTDFAQVSEMIEKMRPPLCIIDSIQTLYSEELSSAPGSVGQVREVTAGLVRLAKNLKITIVLVGHVTKDGSLAGPRVLEHMVDTVLYFESESTGAYRILRAVKNRFGATGELAFFEMSSSGLLEIQNASAILLSGRPLDVPGSVVTSCVQGSRNIFIEIQALTSPTSYTVPQRIAQGMDRNRLGLLLAVLEKKFAAGINNLDVYINVVGGLQISETACDLAVAAAVFSSMKNRPIPKNTLILGEIGLTGEIRPVSDVQKRLSEASRYGFSSCILPGSSKAGLLTTSKKANHQTEFIFADTISEAMDILFSERA